MPRRMVPCEEFMQMVMDKVKYDRCDLEEDGWAWSTTPSGWGRTETRCGRMRVFRGGVHFRETGES